MNENKLSLNVPQDPVFSYPAMGGQINVYVVRTNVIVTFEKLCSEVVYAAENYAVFGARSIIERASQSYERRDNPFEVLLSDTAAIVELSAALDRVIEL